MTSIKGAFSEILQDEGHPGIPITIRLDKDIIDHVMRFFRDGLAQDDYDCHDFLSVFSKVKASLVTEHPKDYTRMHHDSRLHYAGKRYIDLPVLRCESFSDAREQNVHAPYIEEEGEKFLKLLVCDLKPIWGGTLNDLYEHLSECLMLSGRCALPICSGAFCGRAEYRKVAGRCTFHFTARQ